MQIVFLGTSSMMPTKQRNPAAVFLSYKNEGLLFDCGEGTQRQLMNAGIRPTKITRILLSHWHGDHSLGLPGLLQTMAAMGYSRKLEIYGPEGTLKHFRAIFDAFVFDLRMEVGVNEVRDGVFLKTRDFRLESRPLAHRTHCNGYSFIEEDKRRINLSAVKKLEIPHGPLLGQLQDGKTITHKGKKITPSQTTTIVKGKKITYVTDTSVVKNCYELAKDADILICDAVYTDELKELAGERGHMTSLEAGQVAARSNVKKLIITHFSARYKNTIELEKDARTAFDNVIAAKDFMKVNV